LRADSGFLSKKTLTVSTPRAGSSRSACAYKPTCAAIEQIDETAWMTLEDYPATSITQISQATLGDRRLIVRRVRTLNTQGELLPSWEDFPFATDRSDALALVDAEHRQHAVVELAIRDLKD
jgi:hypothetical protein